MKAQPFALVVHHRPETLESLEPPLKDLSVESLSVRTCEEAANLLHQTRPHLVFTDTILPDGTWVDVLNLAREARAPLNVIVVGSSANTRLYVATIERGAFDFILPPFEPQGLSHVLRSALENVRIRRAAILRTAAA